jgi:general secretion pathway protein A
MYQAFYGLREAPFELTADPSRLFLTSLQGEALSTLEYGLSAAKALTLLVGEAGTGKTTLIQAALRSERCRDVRCVYLSNPTLTTDDFVTLLARRLDIDAAANAPKSVLLDHLEATLRARRERGEATALVVDEAQSLSLALLEEIRLLGNIETPSHKLLPLVLAGQPSLADRLEQPDLLQLKQRVTLRCELARLTPLETAVYIAERVKAAGGVPGKLFTREAVAQIHAFAQGIPRTINVVCDNALVSGMALGRRVVDRSMVGDVCRELHLTEACGRTPERHSAPTTDSSPSRRPVDEAPEPTREMSEKPSWMAFRWQSPNRRMRRS